MQLADILSNEGPLSLQTLLNTYALFCSNF